MEGKLMEKIIENRDADPSVIAENFVDLRHRYSKYQMQFAFCELLNICMVFLNMFICDMLFLNKFWTYGTETWGYLRAFTPYGQKLHNPMCELFPTEVACYITIGATTGGKDQSNYLCILSNNLFNQKYFLIIWLWWVILACFSCLGMVYRVARMMMPELSRTLLKWKVMRSKWEMEGLQNLTGADYFMLDRMLDSLKHKVFAEVMVEVGKMTHPKYSPSPEPQEKVNGEMPKYMRNEIDQVDYYKKDSSSAGSGSTNADL